MTVSPQLFDFVIDRIRIYIRDTKELNKLLGNKFESDVTAIRQAILDSINDWNISQPPLAPIDLRTHPAKLLLIRKACIELIRSAMIWHAREHMPSQDGGTSADDHAKFGEYSQWIGMVEPDYEKKKEALKVSMNLQQCYGGISSEYAYEWENWGFNSGFSSQIANSLTGGVDSNINACGNLETQGDTFFDPMEEAQAPPTSIPVAPPIVPEKTGDVLTFILNFSHAPSKKLFTIPAGATVYEVRVQVQTVWSGSSGTPGISVGDVGQTDRLAQEIESDLTIVGTYVINTDYTYATATDIYAYFSNVPLVGTCKIIITYDMAE
jgi:hypothetical protein